MSYNRYMSIKLYNTLSKGIEEIKTIKVLWQMQRILHYYCIVIGEIAATTKL